MANVEIVHVYTEGNVVRGKDPVKVSVTVAPDCGWFKHAKDLLVKFIYTGTLESTEYLEVDNNRITIEDSTAIHFKVKAKFGALTGDYYVQIRNEALDETIASGPEDGTITVSSS